MSADRASAPVTAAPAVPAPVKLRRSRILVAASVVTLLLAALGSAAIVSRLQDTVRVVVMAATVQRGAVVSAADLATAQVRPDPAIAVIPADQADGLVGKRAAHDLVKGSLPGPESITAATVPAPGRALVGIPFQPGQLPASPVRPGTPVRLVGTPRAQDDPAAEQPAVVVSAVVVAATPVRDSAVTVVDVEVAAADAGVAARLAATTRIALLVDPQQ